MLQNKRLLAYYDCLPLLVNGKIAIIEGNHHSLHHVSRFCSISDNYNPLDYAMITDGQWKGIIVYADKGDKETYLVNMQLRERILAKKVDQFRIGDRIHIYSRNGMYTVKEIGNEFITITCQRWQTLGEPDMIVLKSDFKCLAGGINKPRH